MGNLLCNNSPEQQEQQELQEQKYTHVTTKELNEIINKEQQLYDEEKKIYDNLLKKKEHDDHQKHVIFQKEQQQVSKEYLYKIDVGKILMDAAQKRKKQVCIVMNHTFIQFKTSNNFSKFFKEKEDNKEKEETLHSLRYNNRFIQTYYKLTHNNLRLFFDDYKIFVRDVLKLDIELQLVDLDNFTVQYVATW
jgi:hypothetical protein